MKSNTVKLSPYERAINRLNDLPLALDKIFSEALEDLRRQRDEARATSERYKEALEQVLVDINDPHPRMGSIEDTRKALKSTEKMVLRALAGEVKP